MFNLEKFMGKRILTSSLIDDANVTAFFTTRDLPLKAGERQDLIEEVENNKRLVCEGLNIPLENLFIPVQTHSDNVEIVDLKKDAYPDCDALVTNKRNIAIALNFADCVPIVFYDSVKKVVGIAHAGWRGTVAKIGPKTVDKMVKNFDCNPEDIIALIGPSIGQCCFEVKEDVLKQIVQSISPLTPTLYPLGRGSNAESEESLAQETIAGTHADLKLINKIQLLAIGLKKIDVCEYCTSCQSELFFSYRKEKGNTARHSAVITLK